MSRLARPTALNLATILANVGTGTLLTIVAARSWSLATYEDYLYYSFFAGTLAVIAVAALPALAVRLVADALSRGETGRARRVLRVLAATAVGAAAALGAASLAIEHSGGQLRLGGAATVVVALAAAQALATVMSNGAQGAHRFDLVLRTTLATVSLTSIAACLLVATGMGPERVLALLALGHGGLAVGLMIALRRDLPAGHDPGGPPVAEVRRYFLVVSGIVLADIVVWQKSELFFLRRWGDGHDVALYGTAFALAVAAVRMAPAALAGVLTPTFAGLAGRARLDDAAPLFRRGALGMAAASSLLLVAAVALGDVGLRLWGRDFHSAYPILVLLTGGLVLGNVSGVASTVFHGWGRADLLLKGGIFLAAVNLALDVALIPRFGAIGGAIACTAAQAASFPLAIVLLRRIRSGDGRAPLAFPVGPLLRMALATAAGVTVVGLIRRHLTRSDGVPVDLLALVGGDAGTAVLAIAAAVSVWVLVGGAADLGREVIVEDPRAPDDERPVVSIVIPSKNRPDFVAGAVARVVAQDGPRREVIVVDSSDDDSTRDRLRSEQPAVRYARVRNMPNNRHFAKNQGIRLARADVICFLDDDSFVEEGWLERVLAHYERPEVGAVGGRIIDDIFGDGPVGDVIGGIEANGRLHLNFTRRDDRPIEVDHLIGCNMSFRASTLAEVGGFDLRYGGPNFMEETDLCLRVRRAGWTIVFDPDALVHHRNAPRDGNLTRRALDPRGEFWSARSRAYFAWKMLPATFAVVRYNALGILKMHATRAIQRRSSAHAQAALLQTAGLILGTIDWLRAGRPRQPLWDGDRRVGGDGR